MRPISKLPKPGNYGGDYGVMRQHLLERIGSYCSYCEAPITNDTAVEHKVAKTSKYMKDSEYSEEVGFPNQANDWVNLLLACQSCNSAKSAYPNKLKAYAGSPSFPNKMEDYTSVKNTWVWPDEKQTLQLLTYQRSSKTQQALVAAGHARVPSGLPTGSWYTTAAERVWVLPNDVFISTIDEKDREAAKKRVTATILGLNLNYHNPWDMKYSDRRVDNRTYAWDVATLCAADLATVWTALGVNETVGDLKYWATNDHFKLLIRSIRSTALAVGYWSVWWTVLRTALHHAPPAPPAPPATCPICFQPIAGHAPATAPWNGVTLAARKEILRRILVEYWPEERTTTSKIIFLGTDLGTDPRRIPDDLT
ncbi:MAG: HNH endonuclease [Candidatus Methylumidiphilus sp.]